MKYAKTCLILTISILILLFHGACGKEEATQEGTDNTGDNNDSGNTNSDTSVETYQGSGSQWTTELDTDNNTFTVSETDSGLVVEGTFEQLDSGFLKLTVTSSSPGDDPAPGAQAYALNIPGTILLLKPIGAESNIISMVRTGSCPESDLLGNWIETRTQGENLDGSEIFGTFLFTAVEGNASLPEVYGIADPTTPLLTDEDLGNFECEDGVATVEDATLYLSEAGAVVVEVPNEENGDNEDDNAIIVGMPVGAIGNLANTDGTYSGLIFVDGNDAEIMTVEVTLENGSGSVSRYDNDSPENDSTKEEIGTIDFAEIDSPSDGFMRGTVLATAENETGTIVCMAQDDVNQSGQKFVFCAGSAPGDDNSLFNVLLISNE